MSSRAKRLVGLGAAALALAVLAALAGWALYGEPGHVYVRIDNARATAIEPRAGMEHEYRLDGFSADGAPTEATFQTGRVLREGAYLDLETKPLRGVVGWEEVPFDELPAPVREKMGQGV